MRLKRFKLLPQSQKRMLQTLAGCVLSMAVCMGMVRSQEIDGRGLSAEPSPRAESTQVAKLRQLDESPPLWLEEPPPTDYASVDAEIAVPRFRKHFYQGAEWRAGYLVGLGDQAGGMDQTTEEVRASFGVPLGSLDNILVVRPYFRADQIHGPESVDVPGTLYDTGVTFFNRKQWSERFSTTIVLTPSVRSDFTTSTDAFRMFGLGLLNWQCRADWSVSLGAVFLGRADLPVLPAFGASWTPTPWWRLDATLPRPRLSRRLWKRGAEAEGWTYLVGTLGGNTYAVTRANGNVDELSIRDWRVLWGYEEIRAGNRGFVVEAGYAFGRNVEYEREELEIELDDAVFLQAGWQF